MILIKIISVLNDKSFISKWL